MNQRGWKPDEALPATRSEAEPGALETVQRRRAWGTTGDNDHGRWRDLFRHIGGSRVAP